MTVDVFTRTSLILLSGTLLMAVPLGPTNVAGEEPPQRETRPAIAAEHGAMSLASAEAGGTPVSRRDAVAAEPYQLSTPWLSETIGGSIGATVIHPIDLFSRVSIGTRNAEQILHVHGNEILSTGPAAGFKFRNRNSTTAADDWVWYSEANTARLWRAGAGDLLHITTSGNVAIGTTANTSAKLDVRGGSGSAIRGASDTSAGVRGDSLGAVGVLGSSERGTGVVGHSVSGPLFEGFAVTEGGSPAFRYRVTNAGDVEARGTFRTVRGDFAEMLEVEASARPEDDTYSPGDVLGISPQTGKLTKCREAYCPLVAGIYSTRPGFVAGDAMEETSGRKVPVALFGRVPCRVTTENGPISIGDMLVASSTPGYAMKGTDRSRMLGAVVGKALQPLASNTGIIEVLVTLR